MKCLKDRCWSPIACGTYGYCRERNFDGYPMDNANIDRRRRESEGNKPAPSPRKQQTTHN